MRKAPMAVIVAVALGAPAASQAQWYMVAQVGYATPSGDATKGDPLASLFASTLPLTIEVATRLTPTVAVGLYGSYAIGRAASALNSGVDALSTYGAGLEVQVYPWAASRAIAPWLGVAAGWEGAQVTPRDRGSYSLSGLRGDAQAGLDLVLGGNLAIGPVLRYAVGRYTTFRGIPIGAPAPAQATHQWLEVGARMRFEM